MNLNDTSIDFPRRKTFKPSQTIGCYVVSGIKPRRDCEVKNLRSCEVWRTVNSKTNRLPRMEDGSNSSNYSWANSMWRWRAREVNKVLWWILTCDVPYLWTISTTGLASNRSTWKDSKYYFHTPWFLPHEQLTDSRKVTLEFRSVCQKRPYTGLQMQEQSRISFQHNNHTAQSS